MKFTRRSIVNISWMSRSLITRLNEHKLLIIARSYNGKKTHRNRKKSTMGYYWQHRLRSYKIIINRHNQSEERPVAETAMDHLTLMLELTRIRFNFAKLEDITERLFQNSFVILFNVIMSDKSSLKVHQNDVKILIQSYFSVGTKIRCVS